jgi:hypothetical protein
LRVIFSPDEVPDFGVQPDIAAPARYARNVATTAILKKQFATDTDPTRRAKIQFNGKQRF